MNYTLLIIQLLIDTVFILIVVKWYDYMIIDYHQFTINSGKFSRTIKEIVNDYDGILNHFDNSNLEKLDDKTWEKTIAIRPPHTPIPKQEKFITSMLGLILLFVCGYWLSKEHRFMQYDLIIRLLLYFVVVNLRSLVKTHLAFRGFHKTAGKQMFYLTLEEREFILEDCEDGKFKQLVDSCIITREKGYGELQPIYQRKLDLYK